MGTGGVAGIPLLGPSISSEDRRLVRPARYTAGRRCRQGRVGTPPVPRSGSGGGAGCTSIDPSPVVARAVRPAGRGHKGADAAPLDTPFDAPSPVKGARPGGGGSGGGGGGGGGGRYAKVS